MTAQHLAALNGLIANETAFRRRAGDTREPGAIVAAIFRDIGMPDLRPAVQKLGRRVRARERSYAAAATASKESV
jgi:hypothetical protein